jgi:hypothetical protein
MIVFISFFFWGICTGFKKLMRTSTKSFPASANNTLFALSYLSMHSPMVVAEDA